MNNYSINTRKVVFAGLLSALTVVIILVFNFPIFPVTPWLTFDFGDVILLIGSIFLGPIYGLACLFIAAFFEAFVLGKSNVAGFIMHFVASGALILIPGFAYKYKRKPQTLIASLLIGCAAMTLIMIPMNYLIDPIFYAMPISFVHQIIGYTTAFNIIKSLANVTLFYLIYKLLGKSFNQIFKI